jgi:broad specificity phosphatase PhoE
VRLYLVRHASVAVHPKRPATGWHLSPDGRAAADELGGEDWWAALARLYSSAEPKAIATAQRIAARNALPLAIEPDVGEVRGRAWVESDYKGAARRYLRGDPVEGWEARGLALRRVRECIEAIAGRHGQADVGIVSHGLVLTLYLSDLLGLTDTGAVETWESIGFPDYAIVDPAARRLERPFAGPATS